MDAVLSTFSHKAALFVVAKTSTNRFATFVFFYLLQGGHFVNFCYSALSFRIRFSQAFPLLVAHLAICCATMDWIFLSVIRQHYPDFMTGRYWWCLGASGQTCLCTFYYCRLGLSFCWCMCHIYRQEVRHRRKFLQELDGQHGFSGVEMQWEYFRLWQELLFLYVVVFGVVVGLGVPILSVVDLMGGVLLLYGPVFCAMVEGASVNPGR
jgi:hypothetical protein